MPELKDGVIKWFREDGTGYIIDLNDKNQSVYVDSSVIDNFFTDGFLKAEELKKGLKVKFEDKIILGCRVAINVKPA